MAISINTAPIEPLGDNIIDPVKVKAKINEIVKALDFLMNLTRTIAIGCIISHSQVGLIKITSLFTLTGL